MSYSAKKPPTTKLSELVEFQTGLRLPTELGGPVTYLQITDFDQQGKLQVEMMGKAAGDIRAKNLLQAGDILFAAKGSRNFAAVVDAFAGPVVASSSFFVLRLPLHSKVAPAYLAWFLNHPQTLGELQANAQSTSINYISMQQLGDLMVLIPSKADQEKILAIDALNRQEQQLARAYYEKKQLFIQTLLYKYIQS